MMVHSFHFSQKSLKKNSITSSKPRTLDDGTSINNRYKQVRQKSAYTKILRYSFLFPEKKMIVLYYSRNVIDSDKDLRFVMRFGRKNVKKQPNVIRKKRTLEGQNLAFQSPHALTSRKVHINELITISPIGFKGLSIS